MFSALPTIAAASEPFRHSRSAPLADITSLSGYTANQLDDQVRPLPRLAPITLIKPSIKSFAVAPNCNHDDSQSEERDRPDFRQDVRQMVSLGLRHFPCRAVNSSGSIRARSSWMLARPYIARLSGREPLPRCGRLHVFVESARCVTAKPHGRALAHGKPRPTTLGLANRAM